jgi:MerR family transcriptional regulator, copper efflux regulator
MAGGVASRHAASDDDGLVQIGVLAERVGLSLRSVRYYEEVGLLTPTTRSVGGFRLYGPEQEERLLLIKQMKPLGFSLDEMRELLDMLDDGAKATPGSKKARRLAVELDREIDEVVSRRHELEKQLDAVDRLARSLRTMSRHLAATDED